MTGLAVAAVEVIELNYYFAERTSAAEQLGRSALSEPGRQQAEPPRAAVELAPPASIPALSAA